MVGAGKSDARPFGLGVRQTDAPFPLRTPEAGLEATRSTHPRLTPCTAQAAMLPVPSRAMTTLTPHPDDGALTRAIRLPHGTAMVVGTIIGASIFVQPSQVTGSVPSLSGAALVWLLGGALTMLGALVTAELSSMHPSTGGVYVYLREAFGPLAGFLWGWAMFWTMHTGIIAAIAMVVASYVGFLVELGPPAQRAVAMIAILALSWVKWLGVRHGSLLQTAITTTR
jgi:APA family basic amino acid/polyamine antiporter